MSTKKSAKEKTLPKTGICALLGIEGKYVKSHLIPESLTRLARSGEKHIEVGRGRQPFKRASSWYDPRLVIEQGEEILAKIDTAGIDELRKHKLLWGSWGESTELGAEDEADPIDETKKYGTRLIKGVNDRTLRLFFLSLLWRALKTSLEEFSHLENIGIDIEDLGTRVRHCDPGLPMDYPICLDQICSVGFAHNHTPTIREITFELSDGHITSLYYRFYMQGLIVSIYPEGSERIFREGGPLFLGGGEGLLVVKRRFEDSYQFKDAVSTIREANSKWPQFNS